MRDFKWCLFRFLFAMAAVSMIAAPISAGCYSGGYSYAPSYSYQSSYYQPPSYVYNYSYPVAQYIGIPIGLFGQLYVGPQGTPKTTTVAQTTTTTETQTATAQRAATATSTAAVASSGVNADVGNQLLAGLKTLTTIVGTVAQKQEAQEKRIAAVEGAKAPVEAEAPLPDAMVVYKNKCFVCHQEGSPTVAKDKTTKQPLMLFTAKGERAPSSFETLQAFLGHITDGTMPPKGNKLNIAPLTGLEQSSIIVDLKRFPQKKVTHEESVDLLRLVLVSQLRVQQRSESSRPRSGFRFQRR